MHNPGESMEAKFGGDNVEAQAQPEQQELTAALQAVEEMPLHFSDQEYKQKATGGQEINSREVSEDAFLRIMKGLMEGKPDSMNTWSAMLGILERESMQDHPNLETFKQAAQDIAARRGKKWDVPEGYWEKSK